MNRKKKLLIFFGMTFIFLIGLNFGQGVYASEEENMTLSISVDIKGSAISIGIDPSSIHLGEVAKGFDSRIENISVVNSGDINVKLQAVLPEGSEEIFGNLEFNTASCSTTTQSGWNKISGWSGLTVNKPSEYNGTRESYFCVKLNLKNYEGEIFESASLTTDLKIWIMPV